MKLFRHPTFPPASSVWWSLAAPAPAQRPSGAQLPLRLHELRQASVQQPHLHLRSHQQGPVHGEPKDFQRLLFKLGSAHSTLLLAHAFIYTTKNSLYAIYTAVYMTCTQQITVYMPCTLIIAASQCMCSQQCIWHMHCHLLYTLKHALVGAYHVHCWVCRVLNNKVEDHAHN